MHKHHETPSTNTETFTRLLFKLDSEITVVPGTATKITAKVRELFHKKRRFSLVWADREKSFQLGRFLIHYIEMAHTMMSVLSMEKSAKFIHHHVNMIIQLIRIIYQGYCNEVMPEAYQEKLAKILAEAIWTQYDAKKVDELFHHKWLTHAHSCEFSLAKLALELHSRKSFYVSELNSLSFLNQKDINAVGNKVNQQHRLLFLTYMDKSRQNSSVLTNMTTGLLIIGVVISAIFGSPYLFYLMVGAALSISINYFNPFKSRDMTPSIRQNYAKTFSVICRKLSTSIFQEEVEKARKDCMKASKHKKAKACIWLHGLNNEIQNSFKEIPLALQKPKQRSIIDSNKAGDSTANETRYVLNAFSDVAESDYTSSNLRKFYPRDKKKSAREADANEPSVQQASSRDSNQLSQFTLSDALQQHGCLVQYQASRAYFNLGKLNNKICNRLKKQFIENKFTFGGAVGQFGCLKYVKNRKQYEFKLPDSRRFFFQRDGEIVLENDLGETKTVPQYVGYRKGTK